MAHADRVMTHRNIARRFTVRGNCIALSALAAVLVAGLTACGNPLTSDDKPESSASSPAPRVSVGAEERPGESVEIQPYLEAKGFVVSALKTNEAYALFLSLEGKGVRLCDIVISHEDVDWGFAPFKEHKRIDNTATMISVRPEVLLSGWAGEPSEWFDERIVVRLDEVTPELIKQKFDLSRCKA